MSRKTFVPAEARNKSAAKKQRIILQPPIYEPFRRDSLILDCFPLTIKAAQITHDSLYAILPEEIMPVRFRDDVPRDTTSTSTSSVSFELLSLADPFTLDGAPQRTCKIPIDARTALAQRLCACVLLRFTSTTFLYHACAYECIR